MTNTSTPAVGIDLGTTYSAIATLDDNGRPVTLVNAEGAGAGRMWWRCARRSWHRSDHEFQCMSVMVWRLGWDVRLSLLSHQRSWSWPLWGVLSVPRHPPTCWQAPHWVIVP